MSRPGASSTWAGLPRTLGLLAAGVFVTTLIELLAAKHYGEAFQIIPFVVTVVCLVMTVVGWFRTSPRIITTMKWLMGLTAIASALGVYFHVKANIAFVTDFHPDASFADIARGAFNGRDPILAPGILLLGAILGYLAVATRNDVDAV